MTGHKIGCRNLWKVYGEGADRLALNAAGAPSADDLRRQGFIVAVQDASAAVAEGEIFVIMGLSGSGKSTLVRCLSRLIEATAGEVSFDGRDLTKVTENDLIEIRRHKMGMVFQHFALLPHLTILGNVAFPLEIQGMGRKERDARALDMIELVGLKGREDYYPGELSGGQQQRVGIARSLAVEPDVWFLDEPFSALDPLIRREMQDEFLRLQATLKKTIVFITHDIDEAIRVADRVAIMKDGLIIQTGTPEDLVLRPATSYVAEFTRDVPRAKVLSAVSIMQPLTNGTVVDGAATRISADTKIEALAPTLVAASSEAIVIDSHGQAIGRVTREAVVEVLMGANEAQSPTRPAEPKVAI
jgi:glycine betaine/proline transport system ATP-binding protein